MSNEETKPVLANRNRALNSAIYRRKIKKMVQSVKLLRNIPHGTKIPKGRATTVKQGATDKDRTDHAKINNYRLTIETLHFFADTTSAVREPRQKEQNQTPVEQALAEVAADTNKN